MLTLAGKLALMVIVTALLVAGLPVKHGVALLVKIQVTTSPLAGA